MRGEGHRGGVVEQHGRGQPQAGGGGEPVAQVDRGERVETEVAERPVRIDGGRAAVTQPGRRLCADQRR